MLLALQRTRAISRSRALHMNLDICTKTRSKVYLHPAINRADAQTVSAPAETTSMRRLPLSQAARQPWTADRKDEVRSSVLTFDRTRCAVHEAASRRGSAAVSVLHSHALILTATASLFVFLSRPHAIRSTEPFETRLALPTLRLRRRLRNVLHRGFDSLSASC